MGARANPMQKIVMDRLATTSPTSHLAAMLDDAELASPADSEASSVTAHAMHITHALRHGGQPNGEVYFSSRGPSGGAA